jgi:hypothetical protein
MTNKQNLSQNEVAGFLLGLGIGLVVGMLFQPRPAVNIRGLLQNDGTRSASSVARRSQPYSSVASTPGSQAAESMAS